MSKNSFSLVFKKHKLLFLSFLIFFAFSGIIKIFAADWPYNAGDTLDPGCAPGEEDCIVTISSGGTPGGVDTYVQYNDSGAFGGDSNFTWDNNNLLFKVGDVGGTVNDTLFTVNDTTQSITATVGAHTTVGTASFYGAVYGAGLNDMTSGGIYTGINNTSYTITIDSEGSPDTFSWTDDGGMTSTDNVPITGSEQTLSNGVTITFGATTSHTLYDEWYFTASSYSAQSFVNSKLAPTTNIIGIDLPFVGGMIDDIANSGTGVVNGVFQQPSDFPIAVMQYTDAINSTGSSYLAIGSEGAYMQSSRDSLGNSYLNLRGNSIDLASSNNITGQQISLLSNPDADLANGSGILLSPSAFDPITGGYFGVVIGNAIRGGNYDGYLSAGMAGDGMEDQGGRTLNLQGGASTGTADGGSVVIRTTRAGGVSNSTLNTYSTIASFTPSVASLGDVDVIGNNTLFTVDDSTRSIDGIAQVAGVGGIFSVNATDSHIAWQSGLVANGVSADGTGVTLEYNDGAGNSGGISAGSGLLNIYNSDGLGNTQVWNWPTTVGAAGSVLTDALGDGTLSWAAAGGDSVWTLDASNNLFSSGAGNGTMTGTYNIFSGANTGVSNTTGNQNIFSGLQAGYSNTEGSNNIFTGAQAGQNNTTGENNIFSGYQAGFNQQTISDQIAIGYQALRGGNDADPSLNTGTQNTAVGYQAGYSNTSGSSNLFTGHRAGYSNTIGTGNAFSGYQAGYANTTGNYNFFGGIQSGFGNTTGAQNTFAGSLSGSMNTTGSDNTLFGFSAGYSNNIGQKNVFIGSAAGYNQFDTSNQVAIGYGALKGSATPANNTGTQNVAIGYQALLSNTTGDNNTANGYQALYSNTAGYANIANGSYALYSNTTGLNNIANGYDSLRLNTIGSSNIANGSYALYSNTEGNYNIANGMQSLYDTTTGSGNIAIGHKAGIGITTGSNNIIIGYDIDAPSATADGQLSIGNLIFGTGIDGTGTALSTGNIGIGDASPDYLLDIEKLGSDEFIMALTDSDGSCLHNPEAGSETVTCSSDERLKTNITDADSILSYFNDFRIRQYDVLASGDHMIGVIAQEVEVLHPELVKLGGNDFYTVEIPSTWQMIKAIQELDLKITEIENLSNQSFKDYLVAWFEDASNGIRTMFADKVQTKELCVDDVCVTRDQFLQMIENSGQEPLEGGDNDSDSGEEEITEEEIVNGEEITEEEILDEEIVEEEIVEEEIIEEEIVEETMEEEPQDESSGESESEEVI